MLTFEPKFPLAAVTDEFSPLLEEAIPVMREIGMNGAELRVVSGLNILDLSDDELEAIKDALEHAGLQVISIASPILKCILPDGGELDRRFEHDAFASAHTFADQDRLIERALAIGSFFRASIIRVFSYWRTTRPSECLPAVIEALQKTCAAARGTGIQICLENEHACNIATASEAAIVLAAVPDLQLVWDPANALVAGESPFPDGYALLPKNRIAHVHAKDCHIQNGAPIWGPLGTRHVRWKEQIAALREDGYAGYLSLETHWPGPEGNKLEASRICGWNLRGLAS